MYEFHVDAHRRFQYRLGDYPMVVNLNVHKPPGYIFYINGTWWGNIQQEYIFTKNM